MPRVAQGRTGCPGSPRHGAESQGRQVVQVVRQDPRTGSRCKGGGRQGGGRCRCGQGGGRCCRGQRTSRAAAAARAKARVAPVRVGGRIKAPIRDQGRQAGLSGHGAVGRCRRVGHRRSDNRPDGKVIDAKILRSIPLLDQAALDAVRQWEYTPTLLNGEPVPVVLTVTVTFTRK